MNGRKRTKGKRLTKAELAQKARALDVAYTEIEDTYLRGIYMEGGAPLLLANIRKLLTELVTQHEQGNFESN